jgi:hypothetical protein
MWTTVLLPAIQSVWTWLSTVLIPFLQGLVDAFMVGFGPGVWNDWVVGISNALYSLGGPFNTLGDAIVILSNFWTDKLLPAIKTVWTWLQTNIPAAITTAANFWNTTLLPALTTVRDYIVNTVIPALSNVWTWLQTKWTEAVTTATNIWNNTLLPTITRVRDYIQNVVIPTLSLWYTWLQTNLPAAIQTLANANGTVLLPAITKTDTFIRTQLIPILDQLRLLIGTTVMLAVTALAGAWQNVLLPAMSRIWTFIQTNFKPVLEDITKYIMGSVVPGVAALALIFSNLGTALMNIANNGLKVVLQLLKNINDILSKLKLPPWLIPGSPTPFELGLRGIGDAMAELNHMQMPALAARLNKLSLGSMAGGFGQTTINNNSPSWSYVIQAANPLQTSDDLARQVRLLELMHR